MKCSLERLDGSLVSLEIEVDASEVSQAQDQAFKRIVKKYTIPGFRKGKAPRTMFERFVGKGPILEEALDILLPASYEQAIAEQKVEPLGRPDIELVKYEDGESLIYKAKVAVKPEVKLGQYTGLGIPAEVKEVTAEEVEAELGKLREQAAKVEPSSAEELANGHLAAIDYEGFLGGTAFAGGKGENYLLEIGSGTFIPGFEEQLIGMKRGEEREIRVTFPEDYRNKELAGQEATFQIKLNEIKEKNLPELDDEFAKSVGDYASLEELRQAIENNLKQTAENAARNARLTKLINQVVENAEVDPPAIMVDRAVDSMVSDLAQRVQQMGLSLEKYLEMTDGSEGKLREDFRTRATFEVKKGLVLEAVAKQEGLEAEEAEIDAEIARLAELYKQPADTIRSIFQARGGIDDIEESIVSRKTADFLLENN